MKANEKILPLLLKKNFDPAKNEDTQHNKARPSKENNGQSDFVHSIQ